MLLSFFSYDNYFLNTSLTVPTQPSPRFHIEALLPFMNCEMDYLQFADWSADNIDYSRQASRIEM